MSLKVLVVNLHFTRGYQVFLYRETGRLNSQIEILREDGGEIIQEGEMVDNLKPSFTIPQDAVKPLLEAFMEQGVRPDKESVVEGKHEAQGRHLEDLRYLLKLRKEKP